MQIPEYQDTLSNDSPLINLIEVEDESALILPTPTQKKYRKPKQSEDPAIDSTYNFTLENLPVRKEKPSATTSKTQHEEPVSFIPDDKHSEIGDINQILLFIIIASIALAKAFYPNRFRQVVQAMFSIQIAQELIREEKVFFHRSNLMLLGGCLFSFSLFGQQFLSTYLNSQVSLLLIVGVVFMIYLIKFLLTNLLFHIFSTPKLTPVYIFNTLIYNYLGGFLLLFAVVLSYYSHLGYQQLLWYVLAPVLTLVFVLRLARLIILGKSVGVFYLYNILYICTLEILPLVVLTKFFILKKLQLG